MDVKERNRREIEERLKSMGDYVKIHYLTSCLKHPIDFDTKRFVLLKLRELYESRKMFFDAGKMMLAAAPINTTFQAKMNDFVKAAEQFIKAGSFEDADIAFEKALGCGNEKEKEWIKKSRVEYYSKQAEHYFSSGKRNSALIAYEKLLSFNLPESDKKDIQIRLLGLYEKLGKIREFYNLKRVM